MLFIYIQHYFGSSSFFQTLLSIQLTLVKTAISFPYQCVSLNILCYSEWPLYNAQY